MAWIEDVEELRADHARRVTRFMADARRHFATEHDDLQSQMHALNGFRSDLYEATNQLQHEHLLLRLLADLQAKEVASTVVKWAWHPAATGTFAEPDLSGYDVNGQQVIAAEVTTSARPQGVIDKRMAATLAKLNTMEGKRFYCVGTDAMATRARTKVRRAGYDISVLHLQ